MFAYTIPFAPEDAAALLAEVPAAPAVFALGFGANREPYISHSTDLRRRLRRMLAREEAATKRLNLLPHVRSIAWTPVGSAFESDLVLYRACSEAYGLVNARKRLRLRPPAVLRCSVSNDFPRLYSSNKLSRAGLASSFGPFPSRVAAEKYLESVLDLFQLRRCYEDLHPFPEHPGCVYGEMKKCLAPCKQTCSPERYAEESATVFGFLRTRGRSLLEALARDRAAASEAMEFEAAAAIHARYEKVSSVATEAPEPVRLLSDFAAIVVQPSIHPGEVALFSIRMAPHGLRMSGPVPYSTLGMRLHNEQSGSSSLFSHPVTVEPVPLAPSFEPALGSPARSVTPARLDTMEARLTAALSAFAALEAAGSTQEIEDHLALFTRWYYRPASRRTGEVVFSEPLLSEAPPGTAVAAPDVPHKTLLRAISRVARASLAGVPAMNPNPPPGSGGTAPAPTPAPGTAAPDHIEGPHRA